MNNCMSSVIRFVIGIFLLSSHSTFAQPSLEVPPPKEPILPRAANLAEWTILIRPDRTRAREETLEPEKIKEGEKAPPKRAAVLQPVEITVTKDGQTYREVITWSNGKKSEKWILDGMQLREIPQTGDIMRVDSTSYSTDVSDYSSSDFEPLQWLDRANYKGVKLVAGRPAYEFVTENANRRLTKREIALSEKVDTGDAQVNRGTKEQKKSLLVAYLDAKSQMPIYVDDGYVVRIYKFGTPSASLVVPERFAEKFKEWKEVIARKTKPALPP